MTLEEQAAADALAATTVATPEANAAVLAAATVAPDTETKTLLADISLLMGSEVTADRLGNVFAWAKANTENTHLQDLVAIADSGDKSSHGAIILLLNSHAAAAVTKPVGTKLSDRVIKQSMSRTADVPVLQPESTPNNFIQNESNAIVNEARASGVIPSASAIIARLKLEQGTN